jgi:hypothetical protein
LVAVYLTDDDATLGTRYLAKASGAGAFPQLTKSNFARRTRIGEILYAREDFIWETITCGCSQKTQVR